MDGSEPPSLDLQHFDTHLILFLVIIDILVIGCLLYLFYLLANEVAKDIVMLLSVRPCVTSL